MQNIKAWLSCNYLFRVIIVVCFFPMQYKPKNLLYARIENNTQNISVHGAIIALASIAPMCAAILSSSLETSTLQGNVQWNILEPLSISCYNTLAEFNWITSTPRKFLNAALRHNCMYVRQNIEVIVIYLIKMNIFRRKRS